MAGQSKSGRILAALLAGALLLGGCGNQAALGPTADDPVALEIWHYYNGPQKLAFDELVTRFNETEGADKGIVVEAFSQGNVNELAQKVIDAAEKRVGAGAVPAIFASYSDTAYVMDNMGLVAPLDGYFTGEERSRYVRDYLDEGCFDAEGRLKIFPVAKSTEIMMLNRTDWDAFALATGAELAGLGTVEGVTAAARAYYEWTDARTPEPGDGRAFFGRDVMANYLLVGYRQLTGRDFFDDLHGGADKIDRAAVRRLWDNFYVPYVNGWFGAYGRFRSDDVKTGELIALVGSTSGSLYFPDEVTRGEDEGYPIEPYAMNAPVFEGTEPCAVQQGAGMVVSRSDARTEAAAMTFLKWFTEPERNIAFSVGSGYLPVMTEANDMERIRAALGEENPIQARKMEAVLSSAVSTVTGSALYSSRPFDGAAAARAVLENSMTGLARADRETVAAQVAAGIPQEEAAAPFLTDEAFENWYGGFLGELAAALA